MKTRQNNRRGLILLVVLGMLSLFSLLAVTYVVVSSQSRASSVGLARRDYRGTPPAKLLDAAMRPVLRGTTDMQSPLWRHDLLADLYGAVEAPTQLRVRRFEFGLPAPTPPPFYTPLSHGDIERPMLLAGRFLRIPIVLDAQPVVNEQPAGLPAEHDVWTNRIATFLEGPLRGQSFRVIRYIGDTTGAVDGSGNPDMLRRAQNHSIVIDLQSVKGGLVTVGAATQSIREWTTETPQGGTNPQKRGLWLCYPSVPPDNQPTVQFGTTAGVPLPGYQIQLNAAPYNAHGIGIGTSLISGTLSQSHTLAAPFDSTGISTFPVALQPHYGRLGGGPTGDADESYDAADFNNFWMSHRASGATDSTGIIPSFHRAALVNYIVNWKDPLTYTEEDLIATVRRIEAAVARPLSIQVITPNHPAYIVNPNFTGSNPGVGLAGQSVQLNVIWSTNWATDTVHGAPVFLQWVRWLTSGPWDLDSDADNIFDGMWIDPNLPLLTSAEGKLLKTLVSYTIEGLDARLDLNATGNLTQTSGAYNSVTNDAYAVGAGNNLPQGIGFGPADVSLRHLFPDLATYQAFLQARSSGQYFDVGAAVVRNETVAGVFGNDVRSQLNARGRRNRQLHNQLPALPMSVNGRIGLGLDRMGNPLLTNSTVLNIFNTSIDQGTDDAYEARLLSGAYRDLPFSIGEWERFYRPGDWDRSNMSRRLNGTVNNPYAVSPRTRHIRQNALSVSRMAGQSNSLFSLVSAIREYKVGTALPYAAFTELFPMEFHRGQGFNLNRVFGNGVDDDGDGNIDEPEELLQNGVDDDGNGTIDELTVAERNPLAYRQRTYGMVNGAVGQTNYTENYTFGLGFNSGNLDPSYETLSMTSGGGSNYPDRVYHFGQQSRQLLARNLYCLAMLILPNDLYPSNRPTTNSITGNDRARIIAQWAVNVVDFRDADSAMTRFPYDPDPFAIESTVYWEPEIAKGEVVWGNEQQDVVLTESLFTHDLRVKDTQNGGGGDGQHLTTGTAPNRDDDYDQYRIPEGSGFFELLCLRTTASTNDSTAPGVSSSLYGTTGGDKVLNLSALTPADANGNNFPVYRIAISQPHPTGPNTPLGLQDPAQAATRVNTTYQISRNQDLNGLGWDFHNPAGAAPYEIDRVVLFTQPGAITINRATIPDMPASITDAQMPGHVFTNRSGGNMLLHGGQYLVVGPRQTTYFGSRDLGPGLTNHRPNHHRIVLEDAVTTPSNTTPAAYSNWATFFDSNNNLIVNRRQDASGQAITRDCVSMIAATDPATDPNWVAPAGLTIPDAIGLNVSAPHAHNYYLAPREVLDSADTMADPDNNAPGFANMPADAYYDFGGNGTAIDLPDTPFDGQAGSKYPLGTGAGHWALGHQLGIPNPGTQEDWCTAFLQRLADPERPWHAAFNPYITIDWIPIDLTVFSGEESVAGSNVRFVSRQKAGNMSDVSNGGFAAGGPRTFLSYATTTLQNTPASGATGVFFDRELPTDQADTTVNPPTPLVPRPTNGTNHFVTLGYLNSTFELMGESGGTTVVTNYVGVPSTMPAALFWADRPFANPYELMSVPLSAPGQLMQEFSAPATGTPSDLYSSEDRPSEFTHLPNFFQAMASPTGETSAAMLFELTETPSPWSDAEDFVSPGDIDFVTGGNDLQDAINQVFGTLRAPYNRISRFVEPGRVNINDVSEPDVWQGIMWNAMTPGTRDTSTTPPYWTALLGSRCGYPKPVPAGSPGEGFIPNPRNVNLDARFPTQFAGVFKSVFDVGMVPTTRDSVLDATASTNPANVTLMRVAPGGTTPLFAPATNPMPVKQPFVEYLPITRLANLTTTRSNVFSIRVTIGFFEFNAATGIGREYGEDEGGVQRHRGFYVVDRSIPVAYQTGQDLNTDDCIIVRRIIE